MQIDSACFFDGFHVENRLASIDQQLTYFVRRKSMITIRDADVRAVRLPFTPEITGLVRRVELRHLGDDKGPVLELRKADQRHERRNEAVPTQSRDVGGEFRGMLAPSRRESACLVEAQDQGAAARSVRECA